MLAPIDGGGSSPLPPPPPPPPPQPAEQDRVASRIGSNLDDGGAFDHVTRDEVRDSVSALTELNGTDAGAVIDRMEADGTLDKFARESVENQDGWFGPDGLSQDEQSDFFTTMAQRLDGQHLATLSAAYKGAGEEHQQRLAEAIGRSSPSWAKLDYVRELAPRTTDGGTGSDGDYADADAQALGSVLSTLRGDYAEAAFASLPGDQLGAVLRGATDLETVVSYGENTVFYGADTDSDRFAALMTAARSIPDPDYRGFILGEAARTIDGIAGIEGVKSPNTAPLARAVIGAADAGTLEAMGPEVAAKLAEYAAAGGADDTAATLSTITRMEASPTRDAMIRTMFLKIDGSRYEESSALAGAMGSAYAATQTIDPVAAAITGGSYARALGSEEGRALLTDSRVDPAARMWAMEQLRTDPARIEGMINGHDDPWSQPDLVQLHAGARVDRFALARGNEAVTLNGGSDFSNFVGAGLGAPTRGDLPTDETALSQAQAEAAQGRYDFYSGVEPVTKPAEGLRTAQEQLGGGAVQVGVLPVQFSSQESGPIDLQLYRVEGANGDSRFVDNVGRVYESFDAWKAENDLPPGQMTYPADGALDAVGGTRLETANTPTVSDTFWEHVTDVADVAALVGGVVASGVILVGSGGTATPLVAGAWAVALGSAAYTGGRAAADLHDRAAHGQSLSLTDTDARAAWLSLAGSGLTVTGAGVTRLAGLAASESALAANGARAAGLLNAGANYADAAASIDTAAQLVTNWDRMTPAERAQMGLQVAFWGGMTGVSARTGGGNVTDAFNFRAQMNHAMLETGAAIRPTDALRPGEASVTPVRGSDGRITDIRVDYGPGTSREVIDAHTATARALIANDGAAGVMRRTFGSADAFAPGTRGEEVSLEVAKHETLLGQVETQLARTDLPAGDRTALERARGDTRFELAAYRAELDAIRANPALGRVEGLGSVNVKQSAQALLDPAGTIPRDGTAQTSFAALRTGLAADFPDARRVMPDASGALTLSDGTQVSRFGPAGNRVERFTQPQSTGGYGGALFHDAATDTVIAAVNIRTAANPGEVTRVEVPFARNAAGEWRADFSRVAPYGTDIPPTMARDRGAHFQAANRDLREALATNEDGIADRLVLGTDGQNVVDRALRDSPEPYTWHHVDGGGRIELVDTDVHGFFLHSGGFSEWPRGGGANGN